MVQIHEDDLKIVTSPFDYISEGKKRTTFSENAPKWARRILALTGLMKLIRDYKNFETKNKRKVKSFAKTLKEAKKKALPELINFIPSSHLAKIPKPRIDGENPYGNVWSRVHDCELLLRVYEHGCEKIPPIQQLRLTKLMNLIRLTKRKLQVAIFDFSQKVKGVSGFTLE